MRRVLICAAFSVFLTLNSVTSVNAAAVCNEENEFKCENGSCIASNKTCDGVKDCPDGSDETFVQCHNKKCGDLYKCNYGGCIQEDLVCDDKNDCWDESDEHPLNCGTEGPDDKLDEYFDKLMGSCDDLFQCQSNGYCLEWSKICDGQADCSDGSDETSAVCTGLSCPEFAFRCAYGACVESNAVCNHRSECYDGSDEQICRSDETIETISGTKPEWKVEDCKLSDDTGAMEVRDYFDRHIYQPNAVVMSKSVVHLSCSKGYELQGSDSNVCGDGGKWLKDWAKCAPVCSRFEKVHYASQVSLCIYNDRPVDCNQPSHFMGTQMHVTCAPSYKPVNGAQPTASLTCEKSGNWSTATGPLECKPICGYIPATVLSRGHQPWTVSIFQRGRSSQFKHICMGTIVGPYTVVTAEKCFQNDIDNFKSDDHTIYSIAEGNHTIEFDQFEEHGYLLHNISAIHKVRYSIPNESDGNEIINLDILTLVKPFKLSATVKSVCLSEEKLSDPTQIKSHGVQNLKLGDGIVSNETNIYQLTHIVADVDIKYHISAFIKPIMNSNEKNMML